MSVRHRSAHGGRTRLRAAVPILIVMSLASLSGAQLTSAEPPPTATSITAEQARVAGSAIGIVHHAERGGELVELVVDEQEHLLHRGRGGVHGNPDHTYVAPSLARGPGRRSGV